MKNPPALPVSDFIAPPCHEEIAVLYEDESLLVINKPSGLLSLSGKNPLNKDSVYERLLQVYPTATLIHRLDFGTSGVLVVALNKEITRKLSRQFELRMVEKLYHATLMGHLADDEGVIDAPLTKADFPYQKVCEETGKKAQSHYQVLERLKDNNGNKLTNVLFTPRTGRTHQLRVHSQVLGHPIIGCDLYGLTINGVDSQTLANRLMLHASSLAFDHPVTGERMCVESVFS